MKVNPLLYFPFYEINPLVKSDAVWDAVKLGKTS